MNVIKSIIAFFTEHANGASAGRLLFRAMIVIFFITWAGLITLVSTNFPLLLDIYDRYKASNDVQVEHALTVAEQVNTLVRDQRSRLDVDRLYVSKFHNGTVDVTGVHFIFFSRVSESTGFGISNEIATTQTLPLSIFPDMITALSQKNCYYIEEVTANVENSTFFHQMGIRSTMICPIYTIDNKLIGIVGADGVINPINSSEATDLETDLETLSSVLGSLLTQ